MVSIEVLGFNPVSKFSGEGVGNWVKVPFKSISSNISVFVAGFSKLLVGTPVNDVTIFVNKPLLSEIKLLLVVDNGNSFLFSKNHIVGSVVRFLKMEPEVSVWLHGSSSWLSVCVGIIAVIVSHLGSLWNSVAFNDLNFEVDIRVKGDWLSTEWSLGVSTTP